MYINVSVVTGLSPKLTFLSTFVMGGHARLKLPFTSSFLSYSLSSYPFQAKCVGVI